MSKVMFFNVPGYGHINPTLPLVEELVNQGEEVTYYSTEKFREKIERTGSLFHHYEKINDDNIRHPFNPVDFTEILLNGTVELLPQLIKDIQRQKIDYIIHDSVCVWGWAAAQALKIPAVCSTATFAVNRELVKRMSRRSGIPGMQLATMILKNARSAFNIWHRTHQLQKIYHLDISVRNIMNVFVNRSALNLVYTSKELQPMAERFDDSYRFVGAMISPHKDIDDPFLEHIGNKKLIYISLGTVRNDRPDFCRVCLSAFKDSKYLIVMSVGKETNMADLGPIPRNFMVYNFVPSQIESLKKASLFITHGGVSGMNEGLYFGVPLLIFPQSMEQTFNGRQMENAGAGKILLDADLTPEKLRQMAEEIVENDSYRKSAKMVGDSFKAAGGYKRAVQQIEVFKKNFDLVR